MENTSDSFKPGPLLFCMKIERSVCYKVTDNNRYGNFLEAFWLHAVLLFFMVEVFRMLLQQGLGLF